MILELIVGFILLGSSSAGYYSLKKKENIYGRFCICYTKGIRANEFVYIPWLTRVYNTEDEYEYEETELIKLAHNSDANSYFREQGIDGFAIIDLSDGRENYWTRLKFS